MATTNVVSIQSRNKLEQDVAHDRYTGLYEGYFDVEQLVQDNPARRTDLRCIEDYDDEVQQCIETRIAKLLAVDWRLDGAESTFAYKKTLELLTKKYYELATGAFRSMLYGYSVIELIYERDGTFYWPTSTVEKPFEWFNIDRLGKLYFRDVASVSLLGDLVDTNVKFLLTRNQPTYINPRGRPLLAYLFWPVFFRFASWKFWMQFLERSGQPMLVGYGPNPEQVATELRKALMDAVMGMPIDGKVDSISPNNKGEAFDLVEAALVRRIQKLLLGQTLTSDTGSNGVGSKALGQVHDSVLDDKVTASVELIKPTIQQFVNAIYTINFPGQKPPVVTYAIDKGIESARANRDATLVNTGNISFSEEYYITNYGFRKGDFVILDPSKKTAARPADQNKQKDSATPSTSNNKGGASALEQVEPTQL
jgi:phage gp29-like protein